MEQKPTTPQQAKVDKEALEKAKKAKEKAVKDGKMVIK